MAGDWIKVEHSTLDKPEVLRSAEMLGLTRDAALGLFLRYFVWLDRNLSGLCPDVVRNVSMKSLDDVLQCPGFAACLASIGWAEFNDKAWTLLVTNADRHNGTTAKSRALDARRKATKRRDSVRKASGSEPDKNGTREEKRREELKALGATHLVGQKPDAPPVSKPKVNGNLANDAKALLVFLNDRAGKRFPETETNVGIIVARMREGFTAAQIRQVVAFKVRAWKADEKMHEYLRPATLFARSNFSNYVGELVPDTEPEKVVTP